MNERSVIPFSSAPKPISYQTPRGLGRLKKPTPEQQQAQTLLEMLNNIGHANLRYPDKINVIADVCFINEENLNNPFQAQPFGFNNTTRGAMQLWIGADGVTHYLQYRNMADMYQWSNAYYNSPSESQGFTIGFREDKVEVVPINQHVSFTQLHQELPSFFKPNGEMITEKTPGINEARDRYLYYPRDFQDEAALAPVRSYEFMNLASPKTK